MTALGPIYQDQNERAAIRYFIEKYGVSCERLLLNKPAPLPRPDYGFYLPDGRYAGQSLKQAGEFIGDIDACERQLLEEMDNVDMLALFVEGRFGPAPDGGCYTYAYGKEVLRARRDMYYGSVELVRRHYRVNYKHVREKLAEFQDAGVMVVETHDPEDTALALVSLYRQLQKPEAALTTFKRLIPEKYRLDEADADRKRFVLQLMQSVPGGGEELGHALYDAGFRTLHQLVRCFDPWETVPLMDWQAIAKLPLRVKENVRARTIGPAAVKKIRDALGC